jgi:hypothetical protein
VTLAQAQTLACLAGLTRRGATPLMTVRNPASDAVAVLAMPSHRGEPDRVEIWMANLTTSPTVVRVLTPGAQVQDWGLEPLSIRHGFAAL